MTALPALTDLPATANYLPEHALMAVQVWVTFFYGTMFISTLLLLPMAYLFHHTEDAYDDIGWCTLHVFGAGVAVWAVWYEALPVAAVGALIYHLARPQSRAAHRRVLDSAEKALDDIEKPR